MPKRVVEQPDELFVCEKQLRDDIKLLRNGLRIIAEEENAGSVDSCFIFPEAKKLRGKGGLTRYRLECSGTKIVGRRDLRNLRRLENTIVFKKIIFARGSDLRKCHIQDRAVKTLIERVKKHAGHAEPPYHLLGWTPEDVTGADCKPIETPEMENFAACLKKHGPGPQGDFWGDQQVCSGQAIAAMNSIHETPYFGTIRERKIHCGAFRCVYHLGPKCVMKIAKGLGGAHANLAELDAWKILKETRNKEAIRMFLPVVKTHPLGMWSVMPKVETEGIDVIWRKKRRDYANRLYELGIECSDMHEGNVGFIGKDKRIVIIDYGFGINCDIKKAKKKLEQEKEPDVLLEGDEPDDGRLEEREREREVLRNQPILRLAEFRKKGRLTTVGNYPERAWLTQVMDQLGAGKVVDSDVLRDYVEYWVAKELPEGRKGWRDAYFKAKKILKARENRRPEKYVADWLDKIGDKINIGVGAVPIGELGAFVKYWDDRGGVPASRDAWASQYRKAKAYLEGKPPLPDPLAPKPNKDIITLPSDAHLVGDNVEYAGGKGIFFHVPIKKAIYENDRWKADHHDIVSIRKPEPKEPKLKLVAKPLKPKTKAPPNAHRLPDNAKRIVNHVVYEKNGVKFAVPIRNVVHKHKIEGAYWVTKRGIARIKQV